MLSFCMRWVVAVLVGGWVSLQTCSLAQSVHPAEVWDYIESHAESYRLPTGFVYAIAWAESSLNANATTERARGMMQLTRPAWATVTRLSYDDAWDWRINIIMGMRYLAYCREFLIKNKAFSYVRLAACYRYGMHRLKHRGFDVERLPEPSNLIYRELLGGNLSPIPRPGE